MVVCNRRPHPWNVIAVSTGAVVDICEKLWRIVGRAGVVIDVSAVAVTVNVSADTVPVVETALLPC